MTVWNIAHRGGAGLMPENTMAAFESAIAHGYDGAELDVQLSADAVPVVHHDERLNPALARKDGVWLTGRAPRIRDLDFVALQTYDIGRPDPKSDYARAHPGLTPVDGARIPALAGVVAAAREKCFRLFVELKSDPGGDPADARALADATLKQIENYLNHIVFVGFEWRGLMRVKENAPHAHCWFTTDKMPGDVRPVLDAIAAVAEGWFANFRNATPENVAQARMRGLKVGAWTVNEIEDMRRLSGLDAICTDRPDLLQTLE
jgi:glycerophosphoryl diester phosphodiesterase